MELNKLIKRAETLALKKDFSSLEVLEVNLEILKCERNPGAITRIGRFYKERKEFEKSLEYYKLIDKNDDLIYQNISQRNILDINKEIKEIKEENKNKTAISQLKNLEACFKFVLRKEMNSALKLNLIQKAQSLVKTEKDFLLLSIIYKNFGDLEHFNKIYLPIYENSCNPTIVSLIRKFVSPEHAENMCRKILRSDPYNILIKNSLCASLADQQKADGIAYFKECIDQHGIKDFKLVTFHFLQVDQFFFNSPILEWLKQLDKDILNDYLTTLEENNARKDKQDQIKRILRT